jgi:hypothetical protein
MSATEQMTWEVRRAEMNRLLEQYTGMPDTVAACGEEIYREKFSEGMTPEDQLAEEMMDWEE